MLECYQTKQKVQKEFSYQLQTTGETKIILGTWVFSAPNTVMLHTEDITKRKEVEEKIRFQSRILDCIDQAIIATDLEGQVLYFNKAAEYLYL